MSCPKCEPEAKSRRWLLPVVALVLAALVAFLNGGSGAAPAKPTDSTTSPR